MKPPALHPAFPGKVRDSLTEPRWYDPAPQDESLLTPPPLPRRLGDDDPGPDLIVTYGKKARVALRGRHVAPPAERAGGVLAPISTSRLDLDVLVSLDEGGLLTGVLDVIRSRASFLEALLPGCRLDDGTLRRGTSRHMLCHWDRLRHWGVLDRAAAQSVILPCFTVPKKSGDLRLVCDGRKLNRLMRHPPPMLLPSIHEVVSRFLSAEYVVQADGKSWFYQFPLAPDVRDFFSVNLAGARGPFVRASLQVLCMGWSWAPCIAHRSAMVLLPSEDGVAWVDNFFVVGRSRDEAAQKYRKFLRRAQLVGAERNAGAEYGQPRSRFVALGLEFDLEASPRRYRSDPAWCSKLLESSCVRATLKNGATAREFYRAFGGCVWFLYSTGRRLCFYRSFLAFLRRTACVLASSPERWDAPLDICPSALADFSRVVSALRSNVWIEAPVQGEPVVGWSDASDREWAALLELGTAEPVIQGVFASPDAHHIYLKEVFAAWQAVRLAAATRPGSALNLRVDNAAAVAAINKGHSKNFVANEMLCAMFDAAAEAGLTVTSLWVDTLHQRADEYTRGSRASVCGVVLPPVSPAYAPTASLFSRS